MRARARACVCLRDGEGRRGRRRERTDGKPVLVVFSAVKGSSEATHGSAYALKPEYSSFKRKEKGIS